MAILTWDEIDKCQSADEIADLLRSKGVKGIQDSNSHCPLANATGSRVYGDYRYDGGWTMRDCTQTEAEFVQRFDNGGYPDLIEE